MLLAESKREKERENFIDNDFIQLMKDIKKLIFRKKIIL